ncbi:hypothetical protein [Streptosporangium sp. NPDC002524]|uniref:hypothetical protein n=1 Tax=Streptosporangium sp. NPDC002524 TaxID=3154537 RepID=UPI0033267577
MDVIYRGEKHRHGTAPDRFMARPAPREGGGTTWPEHVGDARYGAARTIAPS